MARSNRKWDYTDEHVAIAAENGIDKRAFRQRLYQGMDVETAMTKPLGNQGPKLKTATAHIETVITDKRPPWYLYQYYGMFGSW